MLLNSAITEQAELFSIKPIRLLCKYNTKANFTKSKISYNSEGEQRHFLFFFLKMSLKGNNMSASSRNLGRSIRK